MQNDPLEMQNDPAPVRTVKDLSTGDVARLLKVDPKTVTNYVGKGILVPAYKTGGRHLRFTTAAVLDYLRQRGQPIPPELATPSSDHPTTSTMALAVYPSAPVTNAERITAYAAGALAERRRVAALLRSRVTDGGNLHVHAEDLAAELEAVL